MSSRARDLDLRDARIGAFNIRNLRRVDFWFVFLTLALACIGFVVLYSASTTVPEGATPYYLRQMGFFAIGVIVAAALVCVDYRILISLGPALYVLALLALIATMVAGHESHGAARWIAIGPFRFQPSEPSKFAVLLGLAWFLSTFQKHVRNVFFFLLTFALAGVLCVLILKQPSLSTALTLMPVTAAMLLAAGCRWRHMIALVLIGAAIVPLAYSRLEDYQKRRVDTFLNPSLADPSAEGWQPIQSKITVGSGGMKGKGFLKGTQTHLKFLPEHHTDFIFSALAEEWGFVGSTTVIGIFVLFLLRGVTLARECPDPAGTLFISGAIALLTFHAAVNIAITVGLMPVTGMPLPFLSYGGSFYITTMVCVGVILSIHARRGRID